MIIRFHPLCWNSCPWVFLLSNPPLFFFDTDFFTKEWTRISWQKTGIILQVNWSSSPTSGQCTRSEWQFLLYEAGERYPDLSFMFYVELVPGRVTSVRWHDVCHTSLDGVKYAHRLIIWLTHKVMTASLELALYPPRYHLWGLSKEGCRPCIFACLGLKVWHCCCFEESSRFLGRLSWMLKIDVALLNGHAEFLTLLPSSTVQDPRTKAQRAFGKKYLRLVTAKNRVLVHPNLTLEEAEIEDGECLTTLAFQPQLMATGSAFALWCHGDSAIVVTWGDGDYGGDSSAVRDQLNGVKPPIMPLMPCWKMDESLPGVMQPLAVTVRKFDIRSWACSKQIQASSRAFAAILVTSAAVRDHLKGVLQIQASKHAFAAILEDESVVTCVGNKFTDEAKLRTRSTWGVSVGGSEPSLSNWIILKG